MATRKAATTVRGLTKGAIIDIKIGKAASAKDIHLVIDRILALKGCRACGLIGKLSVFDLASRPASSIATQLGGGAAGITVRVIG